MAELLTAAIIPTFNRASSVVEALDSVAAQTSRPKRVIVVDDGSTDDTAQRVPRWIESHRHQLDIRFIRQANAGVAAARNRGADEAKDCSLLAFLDSDDLWPVDYLQRMLEALSRHPEAVAAVAQRLMLNLSNGQRELYRYDAPQRLSTTQLFVEGPLGTSNTVIRRSAFEQIGGYDPTQMCAEDYQLLLRLSLRGPLIRVEGEPVTSRHRHSGDNATGQLSKAYRDRRYRLAQILDRFVHEDGGARVMPRRAWRRRLGGAWYYAGRALRKLNRKPEARACFKRCVALRPAHARAWWFVIADSTGIVR